jgi:hypothetical protein
MRIQIVAVTVILLLASVAGFGQTPAPVPQPLIQSVQTTPDVIPDCTQAGNLNCGDQRSSFLADVYLGEAVDNFAGDTTLKYLNPQAANSNRADAEVVQDSTPWSEPAAAFGLLSSSPATSTAVTAPTAYRPTSASTSISTIGAESDGKTQKRKARPTEALKSGSAMVAGRLVKACFASTRSPKLRLSCNKTPPDTSGSTLRVVMW